MHTHSLGMETLHERRAAAFHICLVDDDLLAHELVEAVGVQVRVRGRDQVAVTLVEPDLQEVLSLLLDVESLQIVDHGDVVDVAAVLGDTLVTIAAELLLELFHEGV